MSASEYDYVIVGSGSAGGFLAYRLSARPELRVLVLEAGPSDRHWTTTIPAGARYTFDGGPRNWGFVGEPEPHMGGRRLAQPRGKVLGGSSSLNGMVYVRGHPADYAGWAEDGADGWDWDGVLPDFCAIETYSEPGRGARGYDGPVRVQKLKRLHPIEAAFMEAGTQAGHAAPEDYNDGAAQEGVSAFDVNVDGGFRAGTARACLRPAARRPNVTVLTGAQATGVVFEGRRACGVAYRHRGKDRVARAGREVVLAAGAFQTPQLLMLSGIGPAAHLAEHGIAVRADLPGVGANLQDHLEVHLKFRSPHRGISQNRLMARHRILLAGLQWYLAKSGPAAVPASRVGGFFRSGPGAGHPDIQFHFWPYMMEGWSPPPDIDGYCFDVGPVTSEARGSVTLASADPFAAPRMVLNGLRHDADMAAFRAAIGIARDIARQPAFDFLEGIEAGPGAEVTAPGDLDAYVRANANSAYHPCGTARMGADADPDAVCDAAGRVRGVEALRVADASLMPRIPNGNINAPAMMIGERVARLMLAESGESCGQGSHVLQDFPTVGA